MHVCAKVIYDVKVSIHYMTVMIAPRVDLHDLQITIMISFCKFS